MALPRSPSDSQSEFCKTFTPAVFLNFPAFQSLPNSDILTTSRPTLRSCRWRHVLSSHEPDNSRSTLFVPSTPYTAPVPRAARIHPKTKSKKVQHRPSPTTGRPKRPIPSCSAAAVAAIRAVFSRWNIMLLRPIGQPGLRTQRKFEIPKIATPSQSHNRTARGHACGNMGRDDAPRP